MGLLDDAIREHLELKRRHGAPDEEIQRAEQEALGPARRDTSLDTIGTGVPPVEEVPGEEIATEPPPPPPPPVDDAVYADEYEVEPAPADMDALDEPTQIQPADDAAMELEPLEELEEEELEEAPPPGTAKPHGDPALGDYSEPVVHLEDEPEEDPEAAHEEDVLEETPEFLQDTPEHDKLWFEQKPPRDFDFD